MIRQIFSIEENSFDELEKNHNSLKLRSNYYAYGGEYDFCRFYEIVDAMRIGIICIFNSSMIICINAGVDMKKLKVNDLKLFINIYKPLSIEMDILIAKKLEKPLKRTYKSQMRTVFNFSKEIDAPEIIVDDSPRLDDVFSVLSACFPVMINSFDLWLTDTSHRIRRNLSEVYLYKNVSTVTVQYIVENIALIGSVGTTEEYRGKNYARDLLYYVISKLQKQGYSVNLIARENRVSYYEKIGFTKIFEDLIFERK